MDFTTLMLFKYNRFTFADLLQKLRCFYIKNIFYPYVMSYRIENNCFDYKGPGPRIFGPIHRSMPTAYLLTPEPNHEYRIRLAHIIFSFKQFDALPVLT